MVTVAGSRSAGTNGLGAAVDVSPVYMLGGGVHALRRYRSNSLWGRLRRVLTKTVLSVGAVPDPLAGDGSLRLGWESDRHSTTRTTRS